MRCFLGAKKDDIVGDTATEVLDIIPKGGRMVIFDSTSILHEVLPTSDRRMVCNMYHFLFTLTIVMIQGIVLCIFAGFDVLGWWLSF